MKEFFSELSDSLSNLVEEIEDVKVKLEKVKVEAKKAERTGQDIQRKFDEFQAVAQPKIDKINELLEKMDFSTKSEE